LSVLRAAIRNLSLIEAQQLLLYRGGGVRGRKKTLCAKLFSAEQLPFASRNLAKSYYVLYISFVGDPSVELPFKLNVVRMSFFFMTELTSEMKFCEAGIIFNNYAFGIGLLMSPYELQGQVRGNRRCPSPCLVGGWHSIMH